MSITAGSGTYITLQEWTNDVRIRRGPDGTIAVWRRHTPKGYMLIHVLPSGQTFGPVYDRLANGAREKMRKERS